MVESDQSGLPNSMIIAGSTVTVLGIIFLVTVTMAFVMMIAFGAAVALVGILLSRRLRVRTEPGSGNSGNH